MELGPNAVTETTTLIVTASGIKNGDAAIATPARFNFKAKLSRVVRLARHHSLAAFGPISISIAHFLASLFLFRALSGAQFGQFAFLIVISALGLSLTNGLLGAPIASMARFFSEGDREELDTCLKASVALACGIGLIIGVTMLMGMVSATAALLFGAYGGLLSLRSFARTHAFVINRAKWAIGSDCCYSIGVVVGIVTMLTLRQVSLEAMAAVMLCSVALSLMPFGTPFFSVLVSAVRRGSVRKYRTVWQETTRWSLLGVVTTEITINAHAYLVTFISGPKAFALLAVGALFMRPFSLIAAALPDQERPTMARHIAEGDVQKALDISKEYLFVIGGIWFATIALAGSVLLWAPGIIQKKGFSAREVWVVVGLWACITAVRGVRAPSGILLQAAREFQALADASLKSSIVALVLTLLLLLCVGPVASLGGILAGDIVMLAMISFSVTRWKRIAPRNYQSAAGSANEELRHGPTEDGTSPP